MSFLPAVVHAEYRGAFRIRVTFNDRSAKTIDFRQWLDGPIFEPLTDAAYFRRFFVEGGTVVWPNGADIAPEALHEAPDVEKRPNKRLQPTNARRRPVKERRSGSRVRG